MRGAALDDAVTAVAPIVADVRERGDAALLEWTERFDGPRPDGLRVSPERIAAAAVPDDVLAALRRMIVAVRAFNEAQRPRDTAVEAAPGIVSERRWLPLDAAGLCVPSGQPLVMVEVVNSTPEPDGRFKHYWLRVPPAVGTAREGVAWSFGMAAEKYAPQLET